MRRLATTPDGRRMMLALLAPALALALVPAGCASDPTKGYSFSGSFREDVRSVTIPMFANQTAVPGLEQSLTEAIIKQVQAGTPMRVVQAGANTLGADSTLSGTITNVEMRTLSTQTGSGLVQELAMQVRIDFAWRDNRTGKVLVSRKDFAAADSFIPSRPTGERIELGQRAVLERLARDVVHEMRATW